MQNKSNPITVLPTHLFWDVNTSTLEWKKNANLIIERVLQRGTLEQWKTIMSIYGLKKIVNTVKIMRSVDPVSLHFIAAISHTPLDKFRCYNTRYLTQHHWIY
ncbi:MAG: hypothetical protein ABIO81_03150 [Ginsengibacter sp.]